jgi:hypothetical protein
MKTYEVIVPVVGCVVLEREIPPEASNEETLDMIEHDTDNLSFDTNVGHFDLLVDSGSFWIVDHYPIVRVAGHVVVSILHKKTDDVAQFHEAALQTVKDLSFDVDDIGHFELKVKEMMQATVKRERQLVSNTGIIGYPTGE